MIVAAVNGAALFDGALANPDPLGEPNVLQLAEHLGSKEIVDAAHQLSAAGLEDDDWRGGELAEIRDRVLAALSHPELLDGSSSLVDTRRQAALDALGPGSESARSRLEKASPSFLVSHEPAELARQATLLSTLPLRGVVRIQVEDGPEPETWRIDVSCRDRPGLLARLTDSLAESGLDVTTASLATWPDGGVLDSFLVRGDTRPDAGLLTELMERRLRGKITLVPLDDLEVTFEDDVYPWHTLCTVSGPDRSGLLAAIAGALDAAKVDVHAATATSYSAASPASVDGAPSTVPKRELIHNRFQVTDRHGRKLDERGRAGVRRAFGLAN
jgi:predicted amino acid-binding ACT domain protein